MLGMCQELRGETELPTTLQQLYRFVGEKKPMREFALGSRFGDKPTWPNMRSQNDAQGGTKL